MATKKARIIAFYLPQYHPTPENNTWWGEGFTEWTNVGKAKKLFAGHRQPNLPADLGFYDLRLPEARIAQADIARDCGLEGFCYWHYWFGNGKRILERPFNEVLFSGEPDFPFCLGWANETWSGVWHGDPDRILIKQKYSGLSDDIDHFNFALKAFRDKRYIKVHGKPIFYIYRPQKHPYMRDFTSLWQKLAVENGLPGIFFIASSNYPTFELDGFSGFVDTVPLVPKLKTSLFHRVMRHFKRLPMIFTYKAFALSAHFSRPLKNNEYPVLLPNWDNTPRSGYGGIVFHNSSPELFDVHVKAILTQVEKRPLEENIVFLKSWNEWAEGNYMEPDQCHGRQYLEVLKRNIINEK